MIDWSSSKQKKTLNFLLLQNFHPKQNSNSVTFHCAHGKCKKRFIKQKYTSSHWKNYDHVHKTNGIGR